EPRREARRDQVSPRWRCQIPRSVEAALEFGCVRPRTCITIDSPSWGARPSHAVNKAPSKATRRRSGPAAADTPDHDPPTRPPAPWVVLIPAAMGIFSSYYESDAIGPIADLLLRQRHLTQFQIGDLTAVINLPHIVLAAFTGVLIDRYGPARVSLSAAAIGFVGALLTAVGEPYALMRAGRLIVVVSVGAVFLSLLAGVVRWCLRRGVAIATAIFLSLARVGSYTLDKSPTWARELYEGGWQPPLWLGAAISGIGLVAVLIFRILDARWPPPPYAVRDASERVNW